MYSLYSKKENAHEDSIWTCAWGRRPERTEEVENDTENPEESSNKETRVIPATDILVTGGVDDMVKIWQYEDGEIKLRHKLGEHSLGVVSVALSQDAQCEYCRNYSGLIKKIQNNTFSDLMVQVYTNC